MTVLPRIPETVCLKHARCCNYPGALVKALEDLVSGKPIVWQSKLPKDKIDRERAEAAAERDLVQQQSLISRKETHDYLVAVKSKVVECSALCAEQEVLSQVVDDMESQFLKYEKDERLPVAIRECNKLLSRVFNYREFALGRHLSLCPSGKYGYEHGSESWGAFGLMRYYGGFLRYCPYCNAETVFSIKCNGTDGKVHFIKSAFDHFYPAGRYPYLALSIYNLVPACTRCNSNIKGDDFTMQAKSVRPFIDDMNKLVRFAPLIKDLRSLYGGMDTRWIGMAILPYADDVGERGENSARFFRLKDVYEALYATEAMDVLQKSAAYTPEYLRWLRQKTFHDCSPKDLFRLLYGATPDGDEIHMNRLGKMINDVIREFA